MAEVLIQVFRIALFRNDNKFSGYKDVDANDYTITPEDITYFSSKETAEKYLDDSECAEDRYVERIESVMIPSDANVKII